MVRVDSTGLQSHGCVFLSRLAHRSPLWSWKQLKDLAANSLAVRFLTFYVYTEIRTFVVKLRINNPTELCFKPFHILWCVFGNIYIQLYTIYSHIIIYHSICHICHIIQVSCCRIRRETSKSALKINWNSSAFDINMHRTNIITSNSSLEYYSPWK